MKNKYALRLSLAAAWLVLIYLFLPFTPDLINFLFKQFGFGNVKRALIILSAAAAVSAYLPFIIKFKLHNAAACIIAAITLSAACFINITLRIPAQTLHIPEYAILSIFLYRAFTARYSAAKSYFLAALTAFAASLVDELLIQYILPNRYCDFADVALNSAGVVIGIILIFAYRMD
ncbi:MAG: VanZ family protein [Candidatus Omnitrophica bacterium]|nr:VanZ family protein [Candidatus Omnitrophota bacterium]